MIRRSPTLVGYALLLLSLPSLLTLWHFPEVRGAVPPGGMLGSLVSGGLRTGFNPIGANLVAVALLLTALFMTTRFSFSGAHAWASGPKGPHWRSGKTRHSAEGAGALARLARNARAGAHAQAPGGNTLVGPQAGCARNRSATLGSRMKIPRTIELDDESDVFKGRSRKNAMRSARSAIKLTRRPSLWSTANLKSPAAKKICGAQNSPRATNYKLPSVSLLREGERSQKLDEAELKERARAIEEKCQEFDVQGRVTQINPGPVVTTFEFKPEAGIKYSRIIGLTEDLCLALQAESILIERIPGKSTIGIEVPNLSRQTIALREIIEAPEFINSASKLTLAMGRDLHGQNSRHRSRRHAALADRRLHRHRQERVHQLADDVHSV